MEFYILEIVRAPESFVLFIFFFSLYSRQNNRHAIFKHCAPLYGNVTECILSRQESKISRNFDWYVRCLTKPWLRINNSYLTITKAKYDTLQSKFCMVNMIIWCLSLGLLRTTLWPWIVEVCFHEHLACSDNIIRTRSKISETIEMFNRPGLLFLRRLKRLPNYGPIHIILHYCLVVWDGTTMTKLINLDIL